jgi:hypothetical protein
VVRDLPSRPGEVMRRAAVLFVLLAACSSSSGAGGSAAPVCTTGTVTSASSCADYVIAWCDRTSYCCLSQGVCDARCSLPGGGDYCTSDHCLAAVGDSCRDPGLGSWRVCQATGTACNASLVSETCEMLLSGVVTPECTTWQSEATPH